MGTKRPCQQYSLAGKKTYVISFVIKKNVSSSTTAVWEASTGKITKSRYFHDNQNTLKHVFVKDGLYVREKKVNKKKEYEILHPQPSNVIVFNRYYTVLKRCPSYRRRISWIENDENSVALFEYIGSYPDDYRLTETQNIM